MLFQKKHAEENKVIDLSALPPRRNVLRIHSERANFVAKIWRSSLKNKIDEESFVNHGWDNMVTFGGLTKHFLMTLVEYFLIIYTVAKNMILEEIMKKVRTKTKIKKTAVAL